MVDVRDADDRGYGDLSPASAGGKAIAFAVMMVGLGLVAGYIGIIANVVFKVFEPRIVIPEQLRAEGPKPPANGE